jgi:Cu(I)/Ag(I) efflux system membrane protein CusA/SilA
LLTLIVIPAIFGLVKGFGLKADDESAAGPLHSTAPSSEPKRRILEPAQ